MVKIILKTDLHFESIAVIEDVVDLHVWDGVPNLVERNYVVEPSYFPHGLSVVVLVL